MFSANLKFQTNYNNMMKLLFHTMRVSGTGPALSLQTTRKVSKVNKHKFSNTGKLTVQDCDPQEKGTNELSSTISLTLCLKHLLDPITRRGEIRTQLSHCAKMRKYRLEFRVMTWSELVGQKSERRKLCQERAP